MMLRVSTDEVFADIITWDLNTPSAMAEVYVSRVASDLGLNRKQALLVASEMKKQIEQLRAQAAAVNLQFLPPPDPEAVAVQGDARSLPALVTKEVVQAHRQGQGAGAAAPTPLQQGGSEAVEPSQLNSELTTAELDV